MRLNDRASAQIKIIMDISMAQDLWHNAPYKKAAEKKKSINTYNGQNKKGFRPYDRQPCKNLHTAISVNKPKLSVTFITFITVMLYHRRVCSFCARTENHR